MSNTFEELFRSLVPGIDRGDPRFVSEFVEGALRGARQCGASDLHFIPSRDALHIWWRIDGVLQRVGELPAELGPNVVARLKVLAELLTYRNELPQEGRIRSSPGHIEMRVSTFPTVFGEKVVVRLFAETGEYQRLADLGFPADVSHHLSRLLGETSGVLLIAGPAGSGKTTTAYACLRELAARSGGTKSLVSLEDPVESILEGVAQSQVNLAAGFDLHVGLRSLVRQDPEVMLVGEIRDRITAEIVMQASLTGHLVLTTFHAGSAAGGVSRLLDMGIEPYLLRSGVLGVVSQRLVRSLCDCRQETLDPQQFLGLQVPRAFLPGGCSLCRGTGYRGRRLLAELLRPELPEIAAGILAREDSAQLERRAQEQGMKTRWQQALTMVEAGETSPAEIRRVLGFGTFAEESDV